MPQKRYMRAEIISEKIAHYFSAYFICNDFSAQPAALSHYLCFCFVFLGIDPRDRITFHRPASLRAKHSSSKAEFAKEPVLRQPIILDHCIFQTLFKVHGSPNDH